MDWLGYQTVERYKDLNLSVLPLNSAYVVVNTTVDNVGVYSVKDDCFNCPYKLEKHFEAHKEKSWIVDTSVQYTWRVLRTNRQQDFLDRGDKSDLLCLMRPTFHEYGVYRLDVGKCVVRAEVPPVNSYFPLFLVSMLMLLCCAGYTFAKYILKLRGNAKKDEKMLVINTNTETEQSNPTLYVFRGILLSLIIFITTGGGGYPIFTMTWGHLSLAECMFFAFMWSVGLNIPTSMDRAVNRNTKRCVLRDIFVKSFVLVTLGTVIDSAVEHNRTRLPTVWCPLQRMGIAYFVVATAYLTTVQRFQMKSKSIICKAISNVVSLVWCWVISGLILALTVILINIFISFNCLANTSFDQRVEHVDFLAEETDNCNNDFTRYINKLFVASDDNTVDINSYLGFSQGLMGVLTTTVYTMIGLKAGIIYLQSQSHSNRLKLWALWGTLFGVGGIAFAGLSCIFDINLWPISTALLISGTALYAFMALYAMTEICDVTSYVVTSAGVTSLPILCGHHLFSHSIPFSWGLYFNNHGLYLLQNVWIVFVWLVIGVLLMKKRVDFDI